MAASSEKERGTALLSVSDKSGIVSFAQALHDRGVRLISTGGTAKVLRAAGLECDDVASVTSAREILGGRVKTLHPAIHGAILRRRGLRQDDADCDSQRIGAIDFVVCNLYPFAEAVARGAPEAECAENVDIGGPCMIRAAAKNFRHVVVVTSPRQYAAVAAEIAAAEGSNVLDASPAEAVSEGTRRRLAAEAFRLTAEYDAQISAWAQAELVGDDDGGNSDNENEDENRDSENKGENPGNENENPGNENKNQGEIGENDAERWVPCAPPVTRAYEPLLQLKYGLNPHQKPAAVCGIDGRPLPFRVLGGSPGAINVMDALNAYALVRDLTALTKLTAAASFKHLSPAGAAVAKFPLPPGLRSAYELEAGTAPLSPAAEAYARARGADPKSSFGDFIAISGTVDASAAALIKAEVSDGIIADGFEPGALDVLLGKKRGSFVVLEMRPGACDSPASSDRAVEAPDRMEFREILGVGFMQPRNEQSGAQSIGAPVTTAAQAHELPEAARLNLQVSLTALKYTQSNSIGLARDGQMIAVAAGQQSRIDCTRLAAAKARAWALRQHPRVLAIPFRADSRRQERINARIAFIEGEFGPKEASLLAEGEEVPAPLTEEECASFLRCGGGVGGDEGGPLDGLCLASDAFIPFRDNVECAAKCGVRYIVQPGGSSRDQDIIEACDELGITMVYNGGVRLFHH